MKALAAGLTLALVAGSMIVGQAFAAQPEEDLLYHWGECAAVGAMYENAVDEGSIDPRITSATNAFHNFEPRMEAHTNSLAEAMGEERANAVQGRLLADYEEKILAWAGAEDMEGQLLATFGKTMERCLKEATALPAPGNAST